MKRDRQYWLLKTEPREWSWEDQRSNGGLTHWDGVRNRQAQNYMKSMRKGDLCFFYHSGSRPPGRRIVGVVEVTKQWYATSSCAEEGKHKDGDGAVEVRSVGEMRRPVELKDMKGEIESKDFLLLRQPRLSVVPVPERIWERVCEMGGGFGEEKDEEEKGSD